MASRLYDNLWVINTALSMTIIVYFDLSFWSGVLVILGLALLLPFLHGLLRPARHHTYDPKSDEWLNGPDGEWK